MRGTARAILCGIGVFVVLLAASGCAGNESYPNNPKPAATMTVSVFIGEDDIAMSPNPFGAGPTRFIMTNQTGTRQIVDLESDEISRKVAIGSGQTINFKQTTQPGEMSISANNTAANSLDFKVGPQRETAQQDLNQP